MPSIPGLRAFIYSRHIVGYPNLLVNKAVLFWYIEYKDIVRIGRCKGYRFAMTLENASSAVRASNGVEPPYGN
jgi:hypothetical protein